MKADTLWRVLRKYVPSDKRKAYAAEALEAAWSQGESLLESQALLEECGYDKHPAFAGRT